MKTYPEILTFLNEKSVSHKGKWTLKNIQSLCKKLGHPEKQFPSIHIAGTNGKGSTSYKIAQSLVNGGYKTALFTSPHIDSFHERIQLNQLPISEESFTKHFNILLDYVSSISFFEILTLIAFLHFAESNVEIAVFETGLGGTYDATNVITPILSVITTIDYDHTHILGKTLLEIAENKAGIIKPNVPVVIGPNTPHAFFQLKSDKLSIIKTTFKNFDDENSAIAKEALKLIQDEFPLSESAINEGISKRPPCRFEMHSFNGVTIIFDIAHNLSGLNALIKTYKSAFPQIKPNALVTLSKDKEITKYLDTLKKEVETLSLVHSGHPKSAALGSTNIKEEFLKLVDWSKARNAPLLITGSILLMSPIRKLININAQNNPSNMNESYV
ncbi:Mur ligase family protein [Chlamydiales bacterium]|nr:Mur ligase family protein [Chlamydiales bacterium]